MDKKLHVVEGKLLDVVPEMILLVHPLEKSQGSRPDLETTQPRKMNQSFG